ncbi:MAG: 50S ribosomal protein L10 [Thermodesulfobacteriota bacterium]
MERAKKEAFVADVRERLERAKATYLVDYKGLDVASMSRLRKELREAGAEFQVVKNRLLILASRDTDTAVMKDGFVGPCALAITYDDVVAPAKVLAETEKVNQKLEIKFGQMAGKLLDADAVKRLAKLPGREELLAQVLAAMQAVPGSFVRVLNGVAVQFLNVLKALEDKKRAEA